MLNISIEYDILDFDAQAYSRAVQDYVKKQMQEAAKRFAQAALTRIPVRTGFVAGAFSGLASLLGGSARFNPVVQATNRQLGGSRGRSLAQEYYYGGGGKILKTPSSGQQYATPPNDAVRQVELRFVFNFKVDITYFNINDISSSRTPSAPWGAFQHGRDAFLDYMRNEAFLKFPDIKNFTKLRRVSGP